MFNIFYVIAYTFTWFRFQFWLNLHCGFGQSFGFSRIIKITYGPVSVSAESVKTGFGRPLEREIHCHS